MGSWNLRRDVQQLYFNAHYWKQMFLSIPFVCSPLEITGCWNFKLFQGRNSILWLFLLCVYKNIRNSLLDETRDPSCSLSLTVPIENIICGEHMHGVACTPFSALFPQELKDTLNLQHSSNLSKPCRRVDPIPCSPLDLGSSFTASTLKACPVVRNPAFLVGAMVSSSTTSNSCHGDVLISSHSAPFPDME